MLLRAAGPRPDFRMYEIITLSKSVKSSLQFLVRSLPPALKADFAQDSCLFLE